MIVTIMYRNTYTGGDGWTFYPMNVEISDNCPICGGKRGQPKEKYFCEDGEWYTVETWDNECGHVDKYKDCYFEYLALKQATNENNTLSQL